MVNIDPLTLIQFRKKTGMTQKQFAQSVDIPLRTYRSYENGSRNCGLDKFRSMKESLGYALHTSDNQLRVKIDYLRMTFKCVRDLSYFCENFLLCSLSEFTEQETRLMNYSHLWQRGNIWIFDFFDKSTTGDYQMCLQLSGQGCREWEFLLDAREKSWFDFLQHLYYAFEDMRIKRLDIAMDELYKGYGNENQQFHLTTLVERLYKEEVQFDSLKTWNMVGGGNLKHIEDEESNNGLSLYFGSRQSQLYFNFYEKRYEIAKNERISLEESLEIFGIWNRYELRFSDQKAHKAVEEFIDGVDLAEIARGVINKEMQVYDGTNQFGAFVPDSKWQELFGGVDPLKLTLDPKPYSIERTINWLMYQVSNSLALVTEADKILETEYMKMILNSGEITERGEQMISLLELSKTK